MKNVLLLLIFLSLFSCNGQEQKDTQGISKRTNINSTQQKMREKIDLKLLKLFVENSDYRYTLSNGNIVYNMNFFENDGGSQYESKPKPSFVSIYKEFYPNGYIKKKESYVGENVKVGISEYFDEDGNIKTVNENEKFGKIKVADALNFLEKKDIINLKTGEGKFDKDGRPTFELNFNEENDKKYFVISIMQGKPNTPDNFPDIGEPIAFIPLNYKMDGETGKVTEIK